MARHGDGIYLRGKTWWLQFMHQRKPRPSGSVSAAGRASWCPWAPRTWWSPSRCSVRRATAARS